MPDAIKQLQRTLEEFKRSPEAPGVELRFMFADLILEHLRKKDWNQKQLAKKANMKESFISRLIHAEANCTLEIVGRIHFALGIHPYIGERPSEDAISNRTTTTSDVSVPASIFCGQTPRNIHGKEYQVQQVGFEILEINRTSLLN